MTQEYVAAEESIQDAQPIELYSFALPSASYLLTGHGENVSYGGLVYADTQISRGNIVVVPIGQARELTISMALTHPLIQTLLGNGVPPRECYVSIVRIHRALDGSISDLGPSYRRAIHSGYIQEVKTSGGLARIRVPNYFDVALDVKLPIARLSRTCQHVHYGPGCGIDRGGALAPHIYKIGPYPSNPTVVSSSGISVTISTTNGVPDQWARHGEIVRVSDGERRSILDQVGTALKIDVPFSTLNNGDAVEVWAGCDRLVSTCDSKFSNNHNFGGHTNVPISNPAGPTGKGAR